MEMMQSLWPLREKFVLEYLLEIDVTYRTHVEINAIEIKFFILKLEIKNTILAFRFFSIDHIFSERWKLRKTFWKNKTCNTPPSDINRETFETFEKTI